MRNYIGLAHTQHDPALAIVNSRGEVVFAQGSERHLQVKRALHMPPDDLWNIHETLRTHCEPGASLVAATTWLNKPERVKRAVRNSWDRSTPWQLSLFELSRRVTRNPLSTDHKDALEILVAADRQAKAANSASAVLVGKNLQFRVRANLAGVFPPTIEFRDYDHHLTHAAAACYSSPFTEAVCSVLDGEGDVGASSFFAYRNGRITLLPESKKSVASLGGFYQMCCHLCGFDPTRGEEWKVMGMAPYGKRDPRVHELCRSIVQVDGLLLKSPSSSRAALLQLSTLRRRPGVPALDYADFAFTVQEVFCELSAELIGNLHKLGVSQNLVVGGGASLNSSWNGMITTRTPFKQVHAFCAPGDDGNAVGAALLAYYQDNPPRSAPARTMTPYLGDRVSARTLKNVVELGHMKNVDLGGKPLHRRVAELLADGKLVGWVQGRAEFGPRSLGNRSILADPRSADVKERVNDRVKFREEFRPFAPSILHEHGPAYFENYQESPYMERTLRFKTEVRAKVPGVVHLDGTGRLQTVKREWNEKYYDLISAFHEITGVPILLNTSFNVMGKPIVHSVEDAIAVFYTSGLDVLVIEDYLFEKPPI